MCSRKMSLNIFDIPVGPFDSVIEHLCIKDLLSARLTCKTLLRITTSRIRFRISNNGISPPEAGVLLDAVNKERWKTGMIPISLEILSKPDTMFTQGLESIVSTYGLFVEHVHVSYSFVHKWRKALKTEDIIVSLSVPHCRKITYDYPYIMYCVEEKEAVEDITTFIQEFPAVEYLSIRISPYADDHRNGLFISDAAESLSKVIRSLPESVSTIEIYLHSSYMNEMWEHNPKTPLWFMKKKKMLYSDLFEWASAMDSGSKPDKQKEKKFIVKHDMFSRVYYKSNILQWVIDSDHESSSSRMLRGISQRQQQYNTQINPTPVKQVGMFKYMFKQ